MKISETRTYAAGVADVYRARGQADVREAACKASGALSWDVQVTRADGGMRVTIQRVMSPEVPAFFRSFVGDSITVDQVEQWSYDGTGPARAEVSVTIAGQPASMKGGSILVPDGTGSVERTSGEVTVAIPIFGRKVEPEIVKVLSSALRLEQQAAEDWLAQQTL